MKLALTEREAMIPHVDTKYPDSLILNNCKLDPAIQSAGFLGIVGSNGLGSPEALARYPPAVDSFRHQVGLYALNAFLG